MALVRIDYDKCVGCLKCTQNICIRELFAIKDGKPYLPEEGKGCAKCMHCGIVCPEGAILYDEQPMMISEEKPIVADTFADDLNDFLMIRRSYRNFRPEPVDHKLIEGALTAAAWAPSAKNQHPTKYYVVEGRETIDKMMEYIIKYVRETGYSPEVLEGFERGYNMVFGQASTVVMAYARDNAINPDQDTALALDYAELWLQAHGVGSCWSGYLRRFLNLVPELKEMFPLPENNTFHGCLMIGWPGEDYLYIPRRIKQPDIQYR